MNDTTLLVLLPLAKAKGIGIINASPFGSGLLSDRGAPSWHPANLEDRKTFQTAADYCRRQGTTIAQVALQFASQLPENPTTVDPDIFDPKKFTKTSIAVYFEK